MSNTRTVNDERMAGDGGLAFVLIGLIALGVLWRVEVRRLHVAAPVQAQAISTPAAVRDDPPEPIRNFSRAIRSEGLSRFAGGELRETATSPILVEELAADRDDTIFADEKR